MRTIHGRAAVASVAALVISTFALASEYRVDPENSTLSVEFTRLGLSTVRGLIRGVDGTFSFDPRELALSRGELPKFSVNMTVDAASLDTNSSRRDGDLRSSDFLDARRHGTLRYRSTKVEKLSEARLRVTGELEIRGGKKPLVWDVDVLGEVKLSGRSRRAFRASATFLREELGMTANPLSEGLPLYGKEVSLRFDIEAQER